EPEPEPEPEPIPDEIEDLISDVTIPEPDGEEVSEAVVEQIGNAAAASTTLAQQVATNINTVSTNSAIDTLGTIGSVVDISGKASANTASHGNSSGAANSSAAGVKALGSFNTLLSALDSKVNPRSGAPATALGDTQKTA